MLLEHYIMVALSMGFGDIKHVDEFCCQSADVLNTGSCSLRHRRSEISFSETIDHSYVQRLKEVTFLCCGNLFFLCCGDHDLAECLVTIRADNVFVYACQHSLFELFFTQLSCLCIFTIHLLIKSTLSFL
ncbi:hypothetical protein RDI58_022741 [Solanum bulbocastanum]|uniref:Uncharacterized protein n=1 Tax=Solanum bulbocastanum TaxID=147425 RepID=A0AAN8T8J5_SOLBU